MTRTALAWLVHLYTASGLVAAVLMGVLIVHGGDAAFRGAFALMIVATAIDSTDGLLARKVDVKRVLPNFDGALLDNIIDFHTYTTLPVFLLWRAGPLQGKHRIARHLWRMCVAMFIATGSFFMGQAKVFPEEIRILPVLGAPLILVLGAMFYWWIRVLRGRLVRPRTATRRAPPTDGTRPSASGIPIRVARWWTKVTCAAPGRS